jgi:hypothetical protein
LTIQAVPADAIPGGYAGLIENLCWKQTISSPTKTTWIHWMRSMMNWFAFIAELKIARTTFDKLTALLVKVESTLNSSESQWKRRAPDCL